MWKIWGRSLWIEPILVFGFEPIAVREYVLVRARVGGEELLLDEADQPADVVGVAHVRFWREYVAVVIAGHVAFPRDLVLEEIFEPWVDAEAAEERDLKVLTPPLSDSRSLGRETVIQLWHVGNAPQAHRDKSARYRPHLNDLVDRPACLDEVPVVQRGDPRSRLRTLRRCGQMPPTR